MTAEKTTVAFGWRVYGLGVMALGMACLVFGDFDPGQPRSFRLATGGGPWLLIFLSV